MRPMHFTSLALLTVAINSQAIAQQAINIVTIDDEFTVPSMYSPLVLISTSNKALRSHSTLESLSLEELSQMRSSDIDSTWISDRLVLPDYDPNQHRFSQTDQSIPFESLASFNASQGGVRLNDSVRFSVGRNTELRDGNISGNETGLENDSARDRLPSIAQSEGEYDIYDISLEWDAITAGPVTLSLLSGLKAIEADIGKRITIDGDTSIDSAHRFTAMPMVGSGIRWQISDNLSFSGAALTHPIETGDALIDFNASTDLRISNNVGFITGYRIIRSSFEVGSIETDLTQEGLFARLEISF